MSTDKTKQRKRPLSAAALAARVIEHAAKKRQACKHAEHRYKQERQYGKAENLVGQWLVWMEVDVLMHELTKGKSS